MRAISSDRGKVVSGSDDHIVLVWDKQTTQLLEELKGHDAQVCFLTLLEFCSLGIKPQRGKLDYTNKSTTYILHMDLTKNHNYANVYELARSSSNQMEN